MLFHLCDYLHENSFWCMSILLSIVTHQFPTSRRWELVYAIVTKLTFCVLTALVYHGSSIPIMVGYYKLPHSILYVKPYMYQPLFLFQLSRWTAFFVRSQRWSELVDRFFNTFISRKLLIFIWRIFLNRAMRSDDS